MRRRRIEEEAARLVVDRLTRGDGLERDDDALRWAARSPAHGVALAQAEAAWTAADRLRAVVPPADRAPPARPLRIARPSRRMLMGGGLAGVAAAAFPLSVGIGRLFDDDRWQTRVGERRSVALGDGMVMHLNTNTVIDIAGANGRRVVTLRYGEVLVDLAAAAAGSLTVMAGGAVLDAVRTTFDLSLLGQIAELVVAHGSVTVRGQGPIRRIAAGSGAAIGAGTVAVTPLSPVVVDQRLAWRRGMIDLDGQTLAQAVDDFNRYRERPIVIADPSLATLRLGGTFATDDGDAFIDAVQRSFAVTAIRSADGTVLLAPARCRADETPDRACGVMP